MKVEIWSDVMCPFCYIGKRRFESALEEFPAKEMVEVEWKSFQLNPDLITDKTKNAYQSLADQKGISLDESVRMHDYVVKMAAESGLTYNFDKAVVANSFKAHRFTHFAKDFGKQNEAEELLFKSYFTDGENIDDDEFLMKLGAALDLNGEGLKEVLASEKYAEDVKRDVYEAQQVGARGVPFFVFNNKYAVSGAQDKKVFEGILARSFEEWKNEQASTVTEIQEGDVCEPESGCEIK